MAVVLWFLYFASTIIGYIGMKIASSSTRGQSDLSLAPFIHPWGIAATLAWIISALVWPWILTKHPLSWANAFSSIRIVLISVASVLILGETITDKQYAGLFLIMLGVCLSK